MKMIKNIGEVYTGHDKVTSTMLAIKMTDIAGYRPTIDFLVNGKNATCMIHSNAHLYLRFNYANAQYFGIEDLIETGQFGISEAGQTNKSYKGQANKLQFGDVILKEKNIDIFETYPPDDLGFGMLGLQWIRENNIILNYNDNTVAILPNQYQQNIIEKKLTQEGYTPIIFYHNETNNSFFMEVEINQHKANFVISTVTHLIIDTFFAEKCGLVIGENVGSFGGPSGQTGEVYQSKDSFTLKIGQYITESSGLIYDQYKYSNKQLPNNESQQTGGTLGASFMIQNNAVIDFGNRILYLNKNLKHRNH